IAQMRAELGVQSSLYHRLLQRCKQRLEVLRAAVRLHQLVNDYLLDLLLGHTFLRHSWYDPTHKKSDRPRAAAQYPRYGYRRIQVFLARRGHAMSADRTHRIWRQYGFQVPKKRPRRRVAASRPRPIPALGANQVWAYDFVFDACANGQQLKCLTVIDEYTRECLAIDVAGSIRSGRVIEVLSKLVSTTGAPRYLRSDNGPEF